MKIKFIKEPFEKLDNQINSIFSLISKNFYNFLIKDRPRPDLSFKKNPIFKFFFVKKSLLLFFSLVFSNFASNYLSHFLINFL